MKRKNYVAENIAAAALRLHWLSLGILLSVLGSVVMSLIPPLVLGRVIDTLTLGDGISVPLIISYFAFIALTGILDSLRESLLIVFGQKITHSLRTSLSEKIERLSADTLTKQEPGALVSRFVGDVNTVETLFTSGIISMAADAFKIIGILIIIWTRNKGLALMLLIVLPFIFWFTRTVQKRMLAAQLANRVAVSRVTNHVPESLRCIRTIHNLGKESYMEERYDKYIGESYRAVEKTNFYDSVYSPVILVVIAAIVAVVMILSASGNAEVLTFFGMSAGTAVAVINYISQIFTPIESLGMEIQTIQSAVAGAERINEFLDAPEKWESNKKISLSNCSSSCIEFKKVNFGYGKNDVLNNVSFTVKAGEQVTITGRTGAGKSTLFKLILGLYKPDEGEVLINGTDAFLISDAEKRRIFGYVDQKFHMVPGTVKDQITLFDDSVSDEMVLKAAKFTGLHDVIMRLPDGYETECSEEILSQGQWQLLSIARAVAAEPRILLLDEITANLDAETEKAVLRALGNVLEGRTVISVSHRIYEQSGGRVINI